MRILYSLVLFLLSLPVFAQNSKPFEHRGLWMNTKDVHHYTLLLIDDRRMLLFEKKERLAEAKVFHHGYLNHNQRPVHQDELRSAGKFFVVLRDSTLAADNKCMPNLDLFTYDDTTLALNIVDKKLVGKQKPKQLKLEKLNIDHFDITKLPQYIWKSLFDLSQEYKRDFLGEFFDMYMYKITGASTFFYNKPHKRSHHKMLQGFVVEGDGTEHHKDFTKVKFYTNQKRLHTKWLSRKDITPLMIPTFPCLYAKNIIQQIICDNDNLSHLDGELAYLVRSMKLNNLNVIDSQKLWYKKRQGLKPPYLYDKLLDMYNRRLEELYNRYDKL